VEAAAKREKWERGTSRLPGGSAFVIRATSAPCLILCRSSIVPPPYLPPYPSQPYR